MRSHSLVIYGTSGAGRRVVDIALDLLDTGKTQYSSICVIDDAPSVIDLERLAASGVPYRGTFDEWAEDSEPSLFAIGVGDPLTRQKLAMRLLNAGHKATSLVAPSAHVSRTAALGDGCVISPGAELSANCRLGRHVHVMANAAVSHDSVVGDYSNISPGAVIAGGCSLGSRVYVGAGAVVTQRRSIGDGAVIGASACVITDVRADLTVRGVPAR